MWLFYLIWQLYLLFKISLPTLTGCIIFILIWIEEIAIIVLLYFIFISQGTLHTHFTSLQIIVQDDNKTKVTKNDSQY